MIPLAARAVEGWLWRATAPPDGPLGPVEQDPDAVREQACKLVSQDTTVCSPPPPTTVARPDGGGGNFDPSWLSLLLWVLLIVAVLGLLFLLVRWIVERHGGGAARERAGADGDDDLDEIQRDAVAVDRSREPFNWRTEAEAHRLAGCYRDALRCRYRALVGDLARRGLIDEIPGRTTGEERAQLRRVTPAASRPFNSAADLFDGAWYGHYAVDAADDDRFQAFERDVLATAVQAKR